MSFLKEEIKVIKQKDPAIKSSVEVFLYPCFWAILNHRIAHRLYKKKNTSEQDLFLRFHVHLRE